MATNAILVANDAGAPVGDLEAIPLDDTFMIRTDQIDLGERLRPVDTVWAHALGAMIARDGQRTAIEVCRLPGATRWTLVTGGHRLVGAQHAEIEYLRAQVVGANRHERLMSEVLENLARRDLDPIDRAAFIAELVTLHKVRAGIDPDKDGRTASVQARWQKQVAEEAADTNATIALAYGWADGVADQLGMSRRSIYNDLLLYRRLSPSLIARLREVRHPMATNASQLRALAKLEPEKRDEVVDLLLGGWNGKVGDAIAKVKGTNKAIQPDHKRFDTIISTLQRMTLSERLGLFQSADFHALIPAEARELLAPIQRGGNRDAEEAQAHAVRTTDGHRVQAGLGGHVAASPASGNDRLGGGDIRGGESERVVLDAVAVAGGSARPDGGTGEAADAVTQPTPAVAIRASVKPDYLVCLECAEKHEQLTRHLSSKHQLSKADYLQKWKLPLDYPFTAPNLAYNRAQAARKLGLKSGAPKGGDA